MFGLARFDLSTRQIDFNPIGPAPAGMAGIEVTPDKKWAYTVVSERNAREQALRVLGVRSD